MDIQDRYKHIEDDVDPKTPEENEAGNALMYVGLSLFAIYLIARALAA